MLAVLLVFLGGFLGICLGVWLYGSFGLAFFTLPPGYEGMGLYGGWFGAIFASSAGFLLLAPKDLRGTRASLCAWGGALLLVLWLISVPLVVETTQHEGGFFLTVLLCLLPVCAALVGEPKKSHRLVGAVFLALSMVVLFVTLLGHLFFLTTLPASEETEPPDTIEWGSE